MTYTDAYESVKLQLDQTIRTNWLATLGGQELWTGQDILNNDAASIHKRIGRGKITTSRVMELVDQISGLGFNITLIRSRL